jgi:hypothetical protein
MVVGRPNVYLSIYVGGWKWSSAMTSPCEKEAKVLRGTRLHKRPLIEPWTNERWDGKKYVGRKEK